MAEGGSSQEPSHAVQCTDEDNNNDILGFLADRLNHRILPEEVQQLYEDVTEVLQKNRAKDEYIEELELKNHNLEQELHNSQEAVRDLQQRELEGQGQNTGSQGQGRGQMSSCGSDADDLIDRRLNQRLLLKVNTLEKEIQEIRSMYRDLSLEKTQSDGLARQCLLLEDRLNQVQTDYQWIENENQELLSVNRKLVLEKKETDGLARQCRELQDKLKQYQWMEVLYSQKERECEHAVKRAEQLQNQLQILRQNVVQEESNIESSGTQVQDNSLHQAETSSSQQESRSFSLGFPEMPQLTQDESLMSPGNRSIHLGQQTSPQLKRGRFTITERVHQYECSMCSAFFSSKEEALETECSYHPKVPVRAILRRRSAEVDPVMPADIFWPCCNQMGKHARKCARLPTHRFIRSDMKGEG